MDLDIYYIGYLTKKPEWNVNSVIDGFIEEKNGDKYLNISVTKRKKEILEKYSKVWNGIKELHQN